MGRCLGGLYLRHAMIQSGSDAPQTRIAMALADTAQDILSESPKATIFCPDEFSTRHNVAPGMDGVPFIEHMHLMLGLGIECRTLHYGTKLVGAVRPPAINLLDHLDAGHLNWGGADAD